MHQQARCASPLCREVSFGVQDTCHLGYGAGAATSPIQFLVKQAGQRFFSPFWNTRKFFILCQVVKVLNKTSLRRLLSDCAYVRPLYAMD